MTDAPWTRALVYSVTGIDAEIPSGPCPDLQTVTELLGRPDLAAAHHRVRSAERGSYPLPLPDSLRTGLPSLARYAAVQQQLLELLAHSEERIIAQRVPDADERRLLADHPPHFGNVG